MDAPQQRGGKTSPFAEIKAPPQPVHEAGISRLKTDVQRMESGHGRAKGLIDEKIQQHLHGTVKAAIHRRAEQSRQRAPMAQENVVENDMHVIPHKFVLVDIGIGGKDRQRKGDVRKNRPLPRRQLSLSFGRGRGPPQGGRVRVLW